MPGITRCQALWGLRALPASRAPALTFAVIHLVTIG